MTEINMMIQFKLFHQTKVHSHAETCIVIFGFYFHFAVIPL